MSSSDRRVTARSITDLLAVVPYLIGFHPTDSLLALGQHDTRLVFAARFDLPTLDPDGDRDRDEQLQAWSEAIADLMDRRDITAVALIGYGAAEHVDPTMTAVTVAFAARAMPIVEAVRVADGRYFSYTCGNPGCCPPGGTAFDPARSSIPAEAIYAGQVALPDRAAVVAQVAAQDGPAREAILAATVRAERRLTRLVGEGNANPTRQDLARIVRRLSQVGPAAIDQALDRHRAGGTPQRRGSRLAQRPAHVHRRSGTSPASASTTSPSMSPCGAT